MDHVTVIQDLVSGLSTCYCELQMCWETGAHPEPDSGDQVGYGCGVGSVIAAPVFPVRAVVLLVQLVMTDYIQLLQQEVNKNPDVSHCSLNYLTTAVTMTTAAVTSTTAVTGITDAVTRTAGAVTRTTTVVAVITYAVTVKTVDVIMTLL